MPPSPNAHTSVQLFLALMIQCGGVQGRAATLLLTSLITGGDCVFCHTCSTPFSKLPSMRIGGLPCGLSSLLLYIHAACGGDVQRLLWAHPMISSSPVLFFFSMRCGRLLIVHESLPLMNAETVSAAALDRVWLSGETQREGQTFLVGVDSGPSARPGCERGCQAAVAVATAALRVSRARPDRS